MEDVTCEKARLEIEDVMCEKERLEMEGVMCEKKEREMVVVIAALQHDLWHEYVLSKWSVWKDSYVSVTFCNRTCFLEVVFSGCIRQCATNDRTHPKTASPNENHFLPEEGYRLPYTSAGSAAM